MGADAYFEESSPVPALPTSVKTLRVLLFIVAGFTVLTTVGVLLAAGVSPETSGGLIWAGWPGVVGFVVALKLTDPSRLKFWLIIAVAAFLIIGSLSDLGQGDPRGFTTLILPILILVFVLRGSARRYILQRSESVAGRTWRRSGERGAGFVEYAALIVLASLILGSFVALGLQTRVGDGVGTAICKIFAGTNCGPEQSGLTPKTGDDKGGNPKNDDGGKKKDDGCHGFWGCAWSGAKQVGSGFYNVGKGAVDDVVGLVDLVKDPSTIIDAGKYIWDHPLDAGRQLFVDDETIDMWKRGDYGGAIGRTGWNVGSWFIPYYDIGKAVSKVGKLGKLGRLAGEAGKLGKLGKLADESGKAARRADQLAKKGDLDGAERAAEEAGKKADDAAAEARRNGCKIAGIGRFGDAGSGTPAFVHFGRTSATLVVAEGTACGTASNARNRANAAKQAIKELWADRAQFSPTQLQKKYKHIPKKYGNLGKLWNLPRNYSPANAAKFEKAMRGFMKKPETKMKRGSYLSGGRQPVIVFYSEKTRAMVMLKPNGEFISAWQLTQKQMRRWQAKGEIK